MTREAVSTQIDIRVLALYARKMPIITQNICQNNIAFCSKKFKLCTIYNYSSIFYVGGTVSNCPLFSVNLIVNRYCIALLENMHADTSFFYLIPIACVNGECVSIGFIPTLLYPPDTIYIISVVWEINIRNITYPKQPDRVAQ